MMLLGQSRRRAAALYRDRRGATPRACARRTRMRVSSEAVISTYINEIAKRASEDEAPAFASLEQEIAELRETGDQRGQWRITSPALLLSD